jgi:hypothetical protein
VQALAHWSTTQFVCQAQEDPDVPLDDPGTQFTANSAPLGSIVPFSQARGIESIGHWPEQLLADKTQRTFQVQVPRVSDMTHLKLVKVPLVPWQGSAGLW